MSRGINVIRLMTVPKRHLGIKRRRYTQRSRAAIGVISAPGSVSASESQMNLAV